MKYCPPLALALLLTACAVTPFDPQAAHQRQLEKEARENFIAMKAQEHPGRPVVLHDDAPPPPAATPKPNLIAFRDDRQPAPVPPPPPPAYAAARPTSRRADDTVFYWQVQPSRQHTTPREQAAEVRYARALAKRPEDLSPEERLYAHEHY